MDDKPLSDDEFMALAERLETLPLDHADWVLQLFAECQRARAAEAALPAGGDGGPAIAEPDIAQIVLDAAEWLRTLWEVGYMGGEAFPAQPRTAFPQVNVEDILKSALFSRIRQGKHPLPFPPPTRHGVPWHEVVESSQTFSVRARLSGDGWVNVEGCTEWRVVDAGTGDDGGAVRVQHRGKGPIYRLTLDGQGNGQLQRCPAEISRRILRQSRAGIDSYLLQWPREDGSQISVPLRAAHWERAENEAQRWIALHHPQLYGQIHIERSEA